MLRDAVFWNAGIGTARTEHILRDMAAADAIPWRGVGELTRAFGEHMKRRPRIIAVLTLLLLLALSTTACAPTPAQRLATIERTLAEGQLMEHLADYADTAGKLSTAKDFLKALIDIVTILKGIDAVLSDESLQDFVSRVAVAKLAVEIGRSMDIVQAFWGHIDALEQYPIQMQSALRAVRQDPSDATLSALSQTAAAGLPVLGNAQSAVAKLLGWSNAAERFLGSARQEVRDFSRDMDFPGSQLVGKGIEQLILLMEEKLVNKASGALGTLNEQLLQDLSTLEEIDTLAAPPRRGGCG